MIATVALGKDRQIQFESLEKQWSQIPRLQERLLINPSLEEFHHWPLSFKRFKRASAREIKSFLTASR